MDHTGETGEQDKERPETPQKVEAKQAIACSDRNCPIHGSLSVRGRTFEGTVLSDRMQKTVIVQWPRLVKSSKYRRFSRGSSKVKAHNPDCIRARAGDRVKIRECRKLAKTVNFVVIEKMGGGK